MEPMWTVTPEFDSVGHDAVAAPMRRPPDVGAFKPPPHLFEAQLERLSAVERPRLIRGPGAELRIPCPRGEIGVGLSVGHALHGALDTHLPPQRLPVEEQRRPRIIREVVRLFALLVS